MEFRDDAKKTTDYSSAAPPESQAVKVYVRMRPPAGGAAEASRQFVQDEGDEGKVSLKTSLHGEHSFRYSKVFRSDSGQADIFNEVGQPMVDHCLEGYSACVFAYGQTGSGKTYTMFGDAANQGVIPRSLDVVFRQLAARNSFKETAVVVSFLEIYLDRIRDLGREYLLGKRKADPRFGIAEGEEVSSAHEGAEDEDPSASQKGTSDWYLNTFRHAGRRKHGRRRSVTSAQGGGSSAAASDADPRARSYEEESLDVREDADGQVYVRGLSKVPVRNPKEAMDVVLSGFKMRATHATDMNEVSSRSHTVFTIHLMQRDRATGEQVSGHLNLVDLAGSERLSRSHSEGLRMTEALSINSSLTALGKVVMSLHKASVVTGGGSGGATDHEQLHVPYRDSKLTRVLQNYLGGTSFLALLATLHPRKDDADESLSTLQFAHRCRYIVNRPKVNYSLADSSDKDRRIAALTSENALLRRQLALSRLACRVRLARLMLDAGVRGTIAADGRFQAPDGKLLGVSAEMANKSDYVKKGARVLVTGGGPLSEQAITKAAQVLQTEVRKLQKQKDTSGQVAGDGSVASGAASDSSMAAAMKRRSTQAEVEQAEEEVAGRLIGEQAIASTPGLRSPTLEDLAGIPADAAEEASGGPRRRRQSQMGGVLAKLIAGGKSVGLDEPSVQSAGSAGTRHEDVKWEQMDAMNGSMAGSIGSAIGAGMGTGSMPAGSVASGRTGRSGRGHAGMALSDTVGSMDESLSSALESVTGGTIPLGTGPMGGAGLGVAGGGATRRGRRNRRTSRVSQAVRGGGSRRSLGSGSRRSRGGKGGASDSGGRVEGDGGSVGGGGDQYGGSVGSHTGLRLTDIAGGDLAAGVPGAMMAAAYHEALELARLANDGGPTIALQQRIDEYRARIRELKDELDTERSASKKELERLQSQLRKSRARQAASKRQAEESERKMRDALDDTSASYSRQVASVIAQSQIAVSREHKLVSKVPDELRVSSEALHTAERLRQEARAQEEQKRTQEVSRATLAAQAELQLKASQSRLALRGLEQKVREVENGKQEAEQAREQTEKTIAQELKAAWRYAAGLAATIDDIEAGRAPVKIDTTGRRSFVVRRAALPPNPMATLPGGMPYLRKLLDDDFKATGSRGGGGGGGENQNGTRHDAPWTLSRSMRGTTKTRQVPRAQSAASIGTSGRAGDSRGQGFGGSGALTGSAGRLPLLDASAGRVAFGSGDQAGAIARAMRDGSGAGSGAGAFAEDRENELGGRLPDPDLGPGVPTPAERPPPSPNSSAGRGKPRGGSKVIGWEGVGHGTGALEAAGEGRPLHSQPSNHSSVLKGIEQQLQHQEREKERGGESKTSLGSGSSRPASGLSLPPGTRPRTSSGVHRQGHGQGQGYGGSSGGDGWGTGTAIGALENQLGIREGGRQQPSMASGASSGSRRLHGSLGSRDDGGEGMVIAGGRQPSPSPMSSARELRNREIAAARAARARLEARARGSGNNPGNRRVQHPGMHQRSVGSLGSASGSRGGGGALHGLADLSSSSGFRG